MFSEILKCMNWLKTEMSFTLYLAIFLVVSRAAVYKTQTPMQLVMWLLGFSLHTIIVLACQIKTWLL